MQAQETETARYDQPEPERGTEGEPTQLDRIEASLNAIIVTIQDVNKLLDQAAPFMDQLTGANGAKPVSPMSLIMGALSGKH